MVSEMRSDQVRRRSAAGGGHLLVAPPQRPQSHCSHSLASPAAGGVPNAAATLPNVAWRIAAKWYQKCGATKCGAAVPPVGGTYSLPRPSAPNRTVATHWRHQLQVVPQQREGSRGGRISTCNTFLSSQMKEKLPSSQNKVWKLQK